LLNKIDFRKPRQNVKQKKPTKTASLLIAQKSQNQVIIPYLLICRRK
jgi:hypothetical protein